MDKFESSQTKFPSPWVSKVNKEVGGSLTTEWNQLLRAIFTIMSIYIMSVR
jgi:hypothetical protein